jgi:hypothetical protein
MILDCITLVVELDDKNLECRAKNNQKNNELRKA